MKQKNILILQNTIQMCKCGKIWLLFAQVSITKLLIKFGTKKESIFGGGGLF
jgi:hypothetical protein